MTNADKQALRFYVKKGCSIQELKELVGCSYSTIKRYIAVFKPKQNELGKEKQR